MAISRDKLIIGGVVVLGALSALVYTQAKKDQALGTVAAKAADMPDVKGTDDVDKLEITNADKGTVTIEKQGDKWMITKPLSAPANQGSVKQLLDNLKELKATEIVAATPDDDIKKQYSLDDAHAVHLVAYKGADKKVDDVFGKSGGRGEMMMVAGKPQVIAASGYSSYLYARETQDWRDKELFKFDDTNAASIAIENAHGKFSFTKGDKWAGTFNGAPIPNLDETKVSDAVKSMKLLSVDMFADGKTAADTGLDKPAGIFTVALKDGAGTYTLKVGGVNQGATHFATKDGGDGSIVVVNANVSGWALADVSKFEKGTDAGAPAAGKTASIKKP
jgi:hypothetical protein